MKKQKLDRTQIVAFGFVLIFWTITLIHIDRSPPLHDDETWILSPGYKFLSHGIFGSDMFTGLHGMEDHYIQFMPLMPVMQGASMLLGGIGAFQMRFVPVVLGTLTVALTFAAGRKLVSPWGAIVATLFVMVWPWTSPGDLTYTTGIPLFDITHIARYDILTPVFGLTAFLLFIHARRTLRLRYDFLAGTFGGLAALSQSYGLFWVAALALALIVDSVIFTKQSTFHPLLALLLGTAITCLPWAIVLALYWHDFLNQQLIQPERFDLLNVHFYLSNLLSEPRRYFYGSPRLIPASVWLLIGIPAALAGLVVRVAQRRVRHECWLLTLCIVLPLLFAVLLQPKGPAYLPSIAVLFALLIAWLILHLFQTRRRILRIATIVVSIATLVEGAFTVGAMHVAATNRPSPMNLMVGLRQLVPTPVRILGKPPYWLAFPYSSYRSLALVLLISNPARNPEPVSFDAALNGVAPDVVLLDADTEGAFARASTPMWLTDGEQFWAYMRRHDAQLIAILHDNYGKPLKVYRLSQSQ